MSSRCRIGIDILADEGVSLGPFPVSVFGVYWGDVESRHIFEGPASSGS